jgi:hypothetical protein
MMIKLADLRAIREETTVFPWLITAVIAAPIATFRPLGHARLRAKMSFGVLRMGCRKDPRLG